MRENAKSTANKKGFWAIFTSLKTYTADWLLYQVLIILAGLSEENLIMLGKSMGQLQE